jgi:hypothetical protein
MEEITLHHYYFASSGRLIGLAPGTPKVIKISGPYISFRNRVLCTPEFKVFLPLGKGETSRNPPLQHHTNETLNRLALLTCGTTL